MAQTPSMRQEGSLRTHRDTRKFRPGAMPKETGTDGNFPMSLRRSEANGIGRTAVNTAQAAPLDDIHDHAHQDNEGCERGGRVSALEALQGGVLEQAGMCKCER